MLKILSIFSIIFLVIIMKFDIINANSDLGLLINGAKYGPKKLSEVLKDEENIKNIYNIESYDIEKSTDINDKYKNIEYINLFNKKLFDRVTKTIDEGNFPITLGGDHSIVIGSALASINKNLKLGIIWIDAHGDFNTPETSSTGNIHGYPFSCCCGYHCEELRSFSDLTFNPKNAVLFGGSAIDYPEEYNNLKEDGVTIISYEEIRKEGVEKSLNKAFSIALNGTNGVHISYDLDSINPEYAPGVSTPEGPNVQRQVASYILDNKSYGFSSDEVKEIMNLINSRKKDVKSFDLVEFNPLNDISDKTLDIAHLIIKTLIK